MVVAVVAVLMAVRTHARYATVSEGSLLKCSDSMKRSSRFQLMEAGAQGGGCCCVEEWAWAYVYCDWPYGDAMMYHHHLKASWPFRGGERAWRTLALLRAVILRWYYIVKLSMWYSNSYTVNIILHVIPECR